MSLIYKPRGAALEYAPWALNIYRGCTHGCTYCYAPAAIRMDKAAFHAKAEPREAVLRALESGALKREAERHAKAHPGEPVLLSFSSDPLQPAEAEHGLTLRCARVLAEAGCRLAVLTKAGKEACHPLLQMLSNKGGVRHWFGVTVTGKSAMELGAATNGERAAALHLAAALSLRTWLSLEPVLSPEWALGFIESTGTRRHPLHIAVGKLNHTPPPEPIDWPAFRRAAITALEFAGYTRSERNIPDAGRRTYYIKHDLEAAA